MQGWVKFHRKLLDSDLWLSEPFTKGQAWVDLFSIANHKDGFIRVRGNKIDVKRGQVGWSQLKLSERWKWSRGKVRRFLNELETVQQIVQQKSRITTLINIVNYESYQSHDTTDGQQTVQQTDNKQYTNKKDKNERMKEQKEPLQKETFAGQQEPEFYLTKSKRKISGKRLETFNLFWESFGDKRDKANATDSWLNIPSLTDALVSKIVESAKIYAENRQDLKSEGSTPKMAQGWLTSRRWEDEQEHKETTQEYMKRRGLA